MDEDAWRALRATCTRFVNGDGYVSPADLLGAIPPDVVPDSYGDGGAVGSLEEHVAELLGKPAAVYLPSGIMAQGATLRVHADRRTSRTVVWHPHCHLDNHEGGAHQRLHSLVGRPVGDRQRLLSTDDLQEVAEPFAALVIELPQRDLGGVLPSWDDLVTQLQWARGRGAAVHLDGARLWEATAGYGRTPAEIADLFDSVYVSFYKGIGALPGCCVAGPEEDVAEVREWRQRLGGTLFALWPGAASALAQLPERLAEMPVRLAHAREIADALRELPGVRVLPEVPQTPMMHLLLRVEASALEERATRLAEEQGIWSFRDGAACDDPDWIRVELRVGRATCAMSPVEVADVLATLTVDGRS